MLKKDAKIGGYTLLEKVGAGAFGDVWKAERRTTLDVNYFALKFFRPKDDLIDLEKIGKEIEVWKKLKGLPHILSVIELDKFEDYVYVVSDFADGGSLERYLSAKGNKPLNETEAVRITIDILTGLESLHDKNIIHRDLKPDNILILNGKYCLADFGVSREVKSQSKATGTAGTMEYMPPEAFGNVFSPQTDIWAVGVILQRLLTGELPFPQDNQAALVGAIIQFEPAGMPDFVSVELREIVERCLRKNPAERFSGASEMKEALLRWLKGSSPKPTETAPDIFDPADKPTVKFDSAESRTAGKQETPTEVLPASTIGAFIPQDGDAEFTQPYFDFPTDPDSGVRLKDTGRKPSLEIQPPHTQPSNETSETYSFIAPTVESKSNETSPSEPTLNIPNIKPVPESTSWNPLKITLFIVLAGIVGIGAIAGGYFLLTSNSNNGLSNNSNNSGNIANQTELIPYRKGDKFGFCDKNKKLIIDAKYDLVKPFVEGFARVNIGGKYVKDEKGYSFEEGGKWGFIETNGKEIVSPKYDLIEPFSEGLAAVNIGWQKDKEPGKTGFIDRTGKEVIPLKSDQVFPFKDGLAIVIALEYKNGKPVFPGKMGVIDKTGNEVIPMIYDAYGVIPEFKDGLLKVQQNNKFGFVDRTGKIVIPLIYDDAKDFSEGLAVVGKGIERRPPSLEFPQFQDLDTSKAKYGYIDKTGSEIIPLKYRYAYSFNGVAEVTETEKNYFIDRSGNVFVSSKYQPCLGSFQSFSSGVGFFKKDSSNWVVIDKNGNESPFKLSGDCSRVDNGMAVFENNEGKQILINSSGKKLTETGYDRINPFSDGLAAVNIARKLDSEYNTIVSGKSGFIDQTGKEVIPLRYDEVEPFDGDYVLVSLNGRYFYLGKDGTEYYEP